MSLTMRKTGSALLADQQWADYTIYDDGRAIGRIYEDRATRPGLRWFCRLRWSARANGQGSKSGRPLGPAPGSRGRASSYLAPPSDFALDVDRQFNSAIIALRGRRQNDGLRIGES